MSRSSSSTAPSSHGEDATSGAAPLAGACGMRAGLRGRAGARVWASRAGRTGTAPARRAARRTRRVPRAKRSRHGGSGHRGGGRLLGWYRIPAHLRRLPRPRRRLHGRLAQQVVHRAVHHAARGARRGRPGRPRVRLRARLPRARGGDGALAAQPDERVRLLRVAFAGAGGRHLRQLLVRERELRPARPHRRERVGPRLRRVPARKRLRAARHDKRLDAGQRREEPKGRPGAP